MNLGWKAYKRAPNPKPWGPGAGFRGLGFTWTPKVCRIIAFSGYGAIILPTLGGLGRGVGVEGLGFSRGPRGKK